MLFVHRNQHTYMNPLYKKKHLVALQIEYILFKTKSKKMYIHLFFQQQQFVGVFNIFTYILYIHKYMCIYIPFYQIGINDK